jgi:hypothetical protein
LKYNVEDLKSISRDPNEVNRLMQLQSEQAVKQLQALVEKFCAPNEYKPANQSARNACDLGCG